MKEQWWNFGQAANYVQANYPCESGVAANRFLADKIADGSLVTRYENGLIIQPEEWVRLGDIDLTVEGTHISHGAVEYQRASVEKLCNPSNPQARGGRPSKDWPDFLIEVVAMANTPDGLPDRQADLERTMLAWGEENMSDPPKETAVRDMVSRIYKRIKR
ncbi:hypothetical protein NKH14_22625 [Mesorhizobium sp. M1380]|uniref:hypothetical protein n=1 Tax=Mesorhizobium sp. M1380 TaxID=2957093 RepID=UPI003339DCC8